MSRRRGLLVAGAALLCAIGAAAEDPASLRDAYSSPPTDWPAPTVDAGVDFVELGAFVPPALSPETRARAALGAALFADPRLSASGEIACRTCHDPASGWSDGAPAAPGRRAVPGLFTSAFRAGRDGLGWDGRHRSLAEQIAAPLVDPVEMANPGGIAEAAARLAADPTWRRRVRAATGSEEITTALVAELIASFLLTLETPTRFDRFAAGDGSALSDQEILGLHLFRTKARCANCHFGPLLTDDRFHNLGLSDFGEPRADLGRYRITGRIEDVGQFRTPSLRHLGRTAPYMHSGLFPTIAAVVAFYDRGGGDVWLRDAAEAAEPLRRQAAQVSSHLGPLRLTEEERAALVAFLGSL